MDREESHRGDDAVDSERGEDEEEGRAENEQLRLGCGDDTDETAGAAAYSPPLVTNPLLLEASLPATFSTQGSCGLTNTSFELASLGKVTSVVLHACLPFPNIFFVYCSHYMVWRLHLPIWYFFIYPN